MNTYTPEQLAALAAEVGITPETHRQCYEHKHHCERCDVPDNTYRIAHPEQDGPWFACKDCGCTETVTKHYVRINPFDPDADPREVDQCWLVALMWYLVEHGVDIQSLRGPTDRVCSARLFVPAQGPLGAYNHRDWGESFTLPLLNVAIVARVPGICAALGIDT